MKVWQKDQPWRVVKSIPVLTSQLRAACPRAVPPATPLTSWGTIADDAHSSSSSHYPHYISVLGSEAVVRAADYPHAPNLGMDGHTITQALVASRDRRIDYIIFDHRIVSGHPVDGVSAWEWRPYNGSDSHTEHFHVNIVADRIADSQEAWQIRKPVVGDDMRAIIRFTDSPAVFITDYTVSRWIQSETALAQIWSFVHHGRLQVVPDNANDTVWLLDPSYKDAALGVLLGLAPKGFEKWKN